MEWARNKALKWKMNNPPELDVTINRHRTADLLPAGFLHLEDALMIGVTLRERTESNVILSGFLRRCYHPPSPARSTIIETSRLDSSEDTDQAALPFPLVMLIKPST